MGKIDQPTTTEQANKVIKAPVLGVLPPENLTDTAIERVRESVFPDENPDIDVETVKLKRFMGVDVLDTTQDKRIRDIFEWGKQRGMSEPELRREIRKIEMKLGRTDEESLVRKIHTYIVLNESISKSLDKLLALER